MKGLKIIFEKGNARIDTAQSVTDFDSTVQNAMVTISTQRGSSRIFPSKGTRILKNSLEGKIYGMTRANHEAQAAGLQTLFFSREYETSGDATVKLGRVYLYPVSYEGNSLKLNAAFTDLAQSRTVGQVSLF